MRIILIRHGIAEDKKIGCSDFDRSLTQRGRKKLLKRFQSDVDKLQSIDMIICSPSLRARQTCAVLCAVIDMDTDWIFYNKRVYGFSCDYMPLLNLIQETSNDRKHICLVGHNNTISSLASYFQGEEIVMKKGEIRNFEITG